MELLSYSEFNLKKLAKKLLKNQNLLEFLEACENGEIPQIQIQRIESSESYVAIATNSGNPESEVFKTSDPFIALVSLVIKDTKFTTADQILEAMYINSQTVTYSVLPGNRKMTKRELEDRYNMSYPDFTQEGTVKMTNSPIVKTM